MREWFEAPCDRHVQSLLVDLRDAMWALKIERAKLRNALGDAVMKLEEQKKHTADVVKKLEELKREVSGKQGDLMTTGKERCNDRRLGLVFLWPWLVQRFSLFFSWRRTVLPRFVE
jgi:hypothetical protein